MLCRTDGKAKLMWIMYRAITSITRTLNRKLLKRHRGIGSHRSLEADLCTALG